MDAWAGNVPLGRIVLAEKELAPPLINSLIRGMLERKRPSGRNPSRLRMMTRSAFGRGVGERVGVSLRVGVTVGERDAERAAVGEERRGRCYLGDMNGLCSMDDA